MEEAYQAAVAAKTAAEQAKTDAATAAQAAIDATAAEQTAIQNYQQARAALIAQFPEAI